MKCIDWFRRHLFSSTFSIIVKRWPFLWISTPFNSWWAKHERSWKRWVALLAFSFSIGVISLLSYRWVKIQRWKLTSAKVKPQWTSWSTHGRNMPRSVRIFVYLNRPGNPTFNIEWVWTRDDLVQAKQHAETLFRTSSWSFSIERVDVHFSLPADEGHRFSWTYGEESIFVSHILLWTRLDVSIAHSNINLKKKQMY